MAGRTRDVCPGYFCNEKWPSPLAQILFLGLVVYADREGRLEDRPGRLKSWCLPHWECDVDELLQSLCPEFISRYQVGESRFIQVLKFRKHQKHIHPRESQSEIPSSDTSKDIPRTNLGMSLDTPRTSMPQEGQGQALVDDSYGNALKQAENEPKEAETARQRAREAEGVPKKEKKAANREKVTIEDIRFDGPLDTPECRLAVEDWLVYKRERGESYKTPAHLSNLISSYTRDGPDVLIAAIRHSMGCTYKGIVREGKANLHFPTALERKQANNDEAVQRIRNRMDRRRSSGPYLDFESEG